jgi:hypothetical protein
MEAIHIQPVQRSNQLVNYPHLMLPVGFVNAGLAKQTIELASLLQAYVLYLLTAVRFWFGAKTRLAKRHPLTHLPNYRAKYYIEYIMCLQS